MAEENANQTEGVDYELPESRLQIRDDCLVRLTEKGVPISSVDLHDIHDLSVARSVDIGSVLFSAILFGIAATAFQFIQSEGWRWVITIVVGLLGAIMLTLIFDNVLTAKTNYGPLRYKLKDDREDIDAFLVTLQNLQKRR